MRTLVMRTCWIALASLGLAVAAAGCKKRSFNSGSSSAGGQREKPSLLIVQCVGPQGNGGNWASTLGWVSEEWLLRAEQAEVLKDSGSWIYLACAAGGSSGSGVTNAVMALLQNQALFPDSQDAVSLDRRNSGFFTPQETKRLARAMRYIATGVDLNFGETAMFAALLMDTRRAARIERAVRGRFLQALISEVRNRTGLLQNKWPECSSRNGAQWWDGQAAEPCDAVVNFAKYAWLARNLTLAQLDAPVSVLGQEAGVALKYGMKVVSDVPRIGSVDELRSGAVKMPALQSPEYKALDALQASQARHINGSLEKLINDQTPAHFRGLFERSTYGREHAKVVVQGVKSPGLDSHPIARDILAAAPRTGFYTITTAWIMDKANFDPKKKPRYEDLRYIIFGNNETISLIARSPLLKKHLQEPECRERAPQGSLDPCLPRRYVLAVVEKNLYTIQPSVREPNLMEELVTVAFKPGANGAEHMGIVKMLDLAQASSEGMPDFKDMSGGAGEQTLVGVTGGWPDRRVTAWFQAYLIDSLVKEKWRPAFGDVPMAAFMSTFGKPDTAFASTGAIATSSIAPSERSTAEQEDKFDTSAVRSIFSAASGDAKEVARGQKNVDDYVAMQNKYYQLAGPRALSEAVGFPVYHAETSVNWDISRVPAFLVKKSRHLVHLAANAVREGIATSDSGDSQYCMVISKSKLGNFECRRFVGSGRDLQGMDIYNVNANIRARSFVTFNAADPRITDASTESELDTGGE